MRNRYLPVWPLFVLLVSGQLYQACKGQSMLSSPVVRVDLRHKLPQKAQKRLRSLDTSYECNRKVKLQQGAVSQGFIVTWRVLEVSQSKYVTAVQVEPDGETQGGSAPSAAAIVGDVTMTKGGLFTLPVQIRWTATEGCSTISAQKQIMLKGDDATCKPPKHEGMKLLGP